MGLCERIFTNGDDRRWSNGMDVQKWRLADGASLISCFGDVIIPSDIICAQPIMYLINFSSVFTTSVSSDVVDSPYLPLHSSQ